MTCCALLADFDRRRLARMAKASRIAQAPIDFKSSELRHKLQPGTMTYQRNNYDDSLISGDILLQSISPKAILRPDRCHPVHPRNRSSKYNGTEGSLPRGIGPCRSEDEENRQRGDGRNDRNDAGRNNMANRIHAAIVCDSRLPKVMHPTDGQSGQGPADYDSDLADFVVCPDCQKGGEKDEDWNEKGQGRGPGTVGNLHLKIPVREDDCSVSDEMHGPDRDGAHRHGGADQEIPVQETSTPSPRTSEVLQAEGLRCGLLHWGSTYQLYRPVSAVRR